MHIGHYIGLSIAIAVGITIGNFSSERVSAAYQKYEINEAKIAKTKVARARLATDEELKKELQWEEREDSPKGQMLAITCNAWTEEFQQNQNARTKELMLEHCYRYHAYVREGTNIKRSQQTNTVQENAD